ncbi:mycofactocin biosynthesis peptidyl-dipeptidase MftE [Sinomonas flava]|uniref:Mycofactocin biosynthesis peptidyl-dipeptidase MftE n=1 Tax=Sinomonas flava TaxID=496857 RepID=A0ABN3BRY2_9MICC
MTGRCDSPALADARWHGLGDTAVVLVPLGSTEQHGPHLPYDTDTVIAAAVARAAAQRLLDRGAPALVAPALAYGASGEHQDFPGTVSIGEEALSAVVIEMARSLRTWSPRVVFVNGHGGNVRALAAAVAQLRAEGHDAAWAPCAVAGADAHAGRTETSLMLHLAPERVRLQDAVAGPPAPVAELMPALRERGVRAVSPTGVLGDPTDACPEHGALILGAMVESFSRRLTAGAVDRHGCLRDVAQVAP